jgi:hypothetical protein
METSRFTYVIVMDAPAGVSLGEGASHLADGHLLTVAGYHPSDPMSRAGPIEVFGGVPSADLPAAVDAEVTTGGCT